MPSFKDTNGREWLIALNIHVARCVRDQLTKDGKPVDLLNQDLTEVLKQLFSDHILLCDVLYVVANENVTDTTKRVSSADFGRAMSADAIAEGSKALLDALRDFTPDPRARTRVGVLIEEVRRAIEIVHDEADERLVQMQQKLRNATSGLMSSVSPASPESSPGSTPSEN